DVLAQALVQRRLVIDEPALVERAGHVGRFRADRERRAAGPGGVDEDRGQYNRGDRPPAPESTGAGHRLARKGVGATVKNRSNSRGPTTRRQAAMGHSPSRVADFASSTVPASSILVGLPPRPPSRRPSPGGIVAYAPIERRTTMAESAKSPMNGADIL